VTYAGDDLSFVLPVTDANNNPIDLTGWTVSAQIRQRPQAADPPTGAFTVGTLDATGNIPLTLSHTVSKGLNGAYVWDCQVTDDTGLVSTLCGGSITFVPDVSV
jgi:hypothetical protein